MTDLFARFQSAFHHRQPEFLKLELETCSRSTDLASQMYQGGNRCAAERTITDAENCYAMVLRSLSDPKESKRLTIKATQELTAKMKSLRMALDGLQRFREVTNGDSQNDMPLPFEHTAELSERITVFAPTVPSESQNREQIAALAHEFWMARGCPEGTPEEDWLRAEREIDASQRIDEKEVEEWGEQSIAVERAESLVLRFPLRSEVFHGCHATGTRRA